MISMTTDSVLPRERAEFWTDLVSRHVTPMCIEPAGDQRGANTALAVVRAAGVGIRAVLEQALQPAHVAVRGRLRA